MPHRKFFGPAHLPGSTLGADPMPIDLLIDQPAAVAEHFDFALGLQAALTVSLIEAGLDVVPALETDPDPLGVPQLLYAEQPRSSAELWSEIAERKLAPQYLFQFQVFVTHAGVGLDGRLYTRATENAPTRIFIAPAASTLAALIEEVVHRVLVGAQAEDSSPPDLLELMGIDDPEHLGVIIATLGASVRFEMGEGATPVHREIARANKGYCARDASIEMARGMLN